MSCHICLLSVPLYLHVYFYLKVCWPYPGTFPPNNPAAPRKNQDLLLLHCNPPLHPTSIQSWMQDITEHTWLQNCPRPKGSFPAGRHIAFGRHICCAPLICDRPSIFCFARFNFSWHSHFLTNPDPFSVDCFRSLALPSGAKRSEQGSSAGDSPSGDPGPELVLLAGRELGTHGQGGVCQIAPRSRSFTEWVSHVWDGSCTL